MLPPVGTIIVGPCPECQELVVVFCGNVLPLNKETMLNGAVQEKREHMMAVLTQFLRERITQMIGDDSEMPQEEPVQEAESETPVPEFGRSETRVRDKTVSRAPITKNDLDTFSNVELKLLDNRDYFKAIFG
jgi:hypothetical protein